MSKILLTGGSGKLGQELMKWIEAYAPFRKELDIDKEIKVFKDVEMIIHAAAYTDVKVAEKQLGRCLRTNIIGTFRLKEAYPNVPFVYISSEYAKRPVNTYSFSKRIAEIVVSQGSAPYLIIRTLFKPNPWPFTHAFKDQMTNGDYLDVIAPMIAKTIKGWDRKTSKILDIGTGRKTMLELAKRTRPDVIGNSVDDIKDVRIPRDYI